MTIETRKPKIKQTKVFALDSHHGRATYLEVQGEGDAYHVAIPEYPKKIQVDNHIAYEYKPVCYHKDRFPEKCKGNANGTVCYHALAAIQHRVKVAGKVLSLPEDGEKNSAVKLLNLGGQLIKITNQNCKSKWGVVR